VSVRHGSKTPPTKLANDNWTDPHDMWVFGSMPAQQAMEMLVCTGLALCPLQVALYRAAYPGVDRGSA
jgi:hypothetical protein